MAEFLLREVLNRHPPHIRQFLQDSSVLEELDGPSCRTVTGVAESAELLAQLAAENMLVAPRGDGQTYRYHQLFRELLQHQLRATSPERFVALHKVAAQWFEAQGALAAAAAHLTRAGDDRGAFTLLRDHAFDVYVAGGTSAVEQFVRVLDLKRAADEPSRAIDVAISLGLAGLTEEATRWIARAELPGMQLSVADVSRLAGARAVVAQLKGQARECEEAIARMSPDRNARDQVIDALPLLQMRARTWLDDFAGARAVYDLLAGRGHTVVEFGEVMLTSCMAWTACVEGRLGEAERLASDASRHADDFGLSNHPMIGDALRTIGRVLYERGEFAQAESLYERSVAISERSRPSFALLGEVALARLLTVQGRTTEATAAIDQARAYLPAESTSPLLDLVTACEVQLAIASGDCERAAILAKRCERDDRRGRLEAMIHLANGEASAALTALADINPATLRQQLDTAVLRARALDALGRSEADEVLSETIALARQEGFVVALVEGMPELGVRVSFQLRSRPIAAFEQTVLDRLDRPRPSPSGPAGSADLVEQLTPRELTVLRYLSSRLTLNEIASEIFVSVNTMKSHVKAVYRKLGVSSRREAIAVGQRLRLL